MMIITIIFESFRYANGADTNPLVGSLGEKRADIIQQMFVKKTVSLSPNSLMTYLG